MQRHVKADKTQPFYQNDQSGSDYANPITGRLWRSNRRDFLNALNYTNYQPISIFNSLVPLVLHAVFSLSTRVLPRKNPSRIPQESLRNRNDAPANKLQEIRQKDLIDWLINSERERERWSRRGAQKESGGNPWKKRIAKERRVGRDRAERGGCCSEVERGAHVPTTSYKCPLLRAPAAATVQLPLDLLPV